MAATPARRTPLALRLLTVPAVAAITLTGLWLTGGQITNDFGVAMWLSAGWMALAAAGCLAVAVRSPALRAPVLGAYLVTALAAGAYLGAPMFFDDVVDERVATAEPPGASAPVTGDDDGAEAPPRNELLRRGPFVPVRHEASGEAQVIRLASGERVLTLTGFEVDNGPDLRVYLVAGRPRSEGDVRDFVDLGALKGNKGDQQYDIPGGTDVGQYSTAVVWCRAFSVLFTRAPLEPAGP
jgi:Electron transfer DM13